MGCGGTQEDAREDDQAIKHLVKASMRDFSYYIEKSVAKNALKEFFDETEERNTATLEEAVMAFREISVTVTVDELTRLMELSGEENKEELSTDDFIRVLISKSNDNIVDCENCMIFLSKDKAFTGKIAGAEFAEIVKALGYTGDDVEKDVQEQRGIEELYYNQFKQIMQKYK